MLSSLLMLLALTDGVDRLLLENGEGGRNGVVHTASSVAAGECHFHSIVFRSWVSTRSNTLEAELVEFGRIFWGRDFSSAFLLPVVQ